MGGYGSGRRGFRRRPRTTSVPRLDIAALPRERIARLPFTVTWTRGMAGGARPWWGCPACGGRVRILYNCAGWRCRTCAGLAYPSQLQDVAQRAGTRAQKLRVRLGGAAAGFLTDVPPRPPRMHQTTYNRLVRALVEAETRSMLPLVIGRQT
jgi:hypothetical protein